MELPHKVARRGLGQKLHVEYACPSCKSGLRSLLSEAGKSDKCPDCGCAFTVPGVEAWRTEESKSQQDAQQRASAAKRVAEDEAAAEARRWEAVQRETASRRRAAQVSQSRPKRRGAAIGFVGVLFFYFGLIAFVVGLVMGTTVSTGSGGAFGLPSSVENIGLLWTKAYLVFGGLMAWIGGAVLRALDHLLADLHDLRIELWKGREAEREENP